MKSTGSPAPLIMPSPAPILAAPPRWNTSNLGWRLGTDFVSAACAGVLVAPVISIIDRSIMENASGRDTFSNSIRSSLRNLFLRPQSLLLSRPFGLILLVYGGTYLTANTFDTATSTLRNRPAHTVTSGTGKFAASSAANIFLGIYKDKVFVRIFGPPGVVPRPVPLASYALFALRDCLTIFASFNVPPLLAPYINSRISEDFKRRVSGLTMAQFAAPAAVQLLSTPVHLLGLDLYNRPGTSQQVPWANRWALVGKNWLVSTTARICRIVPGFGVGAVVNRKVRNSLMEKVA
ncbi:hypothetical protein B0I35DRAFT_430034 [Stachybotrys elegans]|uniref:Sequence orphan n=1 Tax=Stachybotrys elegans TaxID=80388 RepID=A0A8K0WT15_9HYPO|nr:hypothetical protein B0I35DRAFT_430034 [Stachybotrys elegans]